MKILLMLFLCLIGFVSCGQTENQDLHKEVVFVPNGKSTIESKPKLPITFKVDSVDVAKNLLHQWSAKNLIETKIGKVVDFYSVGDEKDSFALIKGNAFLGTIHECYDEHRPLILSPDAIWLTICQGVSIHVNQNFDSLKNVLFYANKPDQLIARNDSLDKNQDQWASLIADLSNQTQKYTKSEFYKFFVPNFSTTTETHITAYQITLLEVYKQAFTYLGESGCGIPSITLKGTTKDWEWIYQNLDVLDKFGLTAWKNELKPLITEFIETSKGQINLAFWKDIYKYAIEYNNLYVSGWIIKFFPYINGVEGEFVWDEEMGMDRANKTYRPNKFIYGNDYRKSTLSLNAFPGGISEVDLLWKNYFTNTTSEMILYAGFFGAIQNQDKSLEPYISWAVANKKNSEINAHFWNKRDENMVHKDNYWSPRFAKNPKHPAIYFASKFQTQAQSLSYIKELILDSLAKNPSTKGISTTGLTVTIEIFYTGQLGEIVVNGTTEQQNILKEPILGMIRSLPESWTSAQSEVSSVIRLMEAPEGEELIIDVNSTVMLAFDE